MHCSNYIPSVIVMESSDYGVQMVCSGDICVRFVTVKAKTAEATFVFNLHWQQKLVEEKKHKKSIIQSLLPQHGVSVSTAQLWVHSNALRP